MADEHIPSPAQQPAIATVDDNLISAAAPQQEGIVGDKQPYITELIQIENPNTNNASNDISEGPRITIGPNAPIVTPLGQLTEKPTCIQCPFCKQTTRTRVTHESTPQQMIAGIVLCLFCVCLACLPCMGGWYEDVHIFCLSCGNRVATIPYSGGRVQLAPAPTGR